MPPNASGRRACACSTRRPMSEREAASRRSETSGIGEIVEVHVDAFPQFFMTQLGRPFLRQYYRCVEAYPLGILLTETSPSGCVGFVAGFVDPTGFYRELRRRRLRLGVAALAGVVARPRRLVTAMVNYRRAGTA